MRRVPISLAGLVLVAALTTGSRCGFHLPAGSALFASPQANPIALSRQGDLVYVANTTSNSVSVVSTRVHRELEQIAVGIEPVSLALRPDGKQIWVSNHLSDSVSVIDTDPRSPTYHRVVATVQDLDENGVTRFDEPVGIAFASDAKGYVALSSRNEIAVVDIADGHYTVREQRIRITAQDPRAIAVRGERLYVAAFESSNQSEVSHCDRIDGTTQCTSGILDPLPEAPLLHIVRDPDVPDRDLFVFDTGDESLVDVVSHLGTLLYGLAVDGRGRVYVSHTEARNTVNGLEGSLLADLDNRIYLNRIAAVDCGGPACSFDTAADLIELEPPPPQPVAEGRQLATPYGIAISEDDRTIVATAAASSRLFTVDAESGAVRDVLDVGSIPRGLALRSRRGSGKPQTAYVLNTLDNSVSVVDVSKPDRLREVARIPVGSDPTPQAVRVGRIAFNDARASSSGTFACASCHPDGGGDQLLWRIGAACSIEGDPRCGIPQPRTTQPIRGLRNTLPLHWDGSLGDPFGGPNGEVGVDGDGGSDCALGDADGDHDCFRDLVEESLAGVMCDQNGDCPRGGNELSPAERDDLAIFLASVWHPPARSRAVDDRVSAQALDGFADFFLDQGALDLTCASSGGCHSLPLGAATNGLNPGLGARDAPSLRGLSDRFVLLTLGGNSPEEVLRLANDPAEVQFPFDPTPSEFPYDPALGYDERSTFAVGFMIFRTTLDVGPVDIFQMVEEASTGTSGAVGRQITLGAETLDAEQQAATLALLSQLEAADARGVVRLRGTAARGRGRRHAPDAVTYLPTQGAYLVGDSQLTREQLIAAARHGVLTVTLTAHLPPLFGLEVHRQPLLATFPGAGPTGDPALPVLPGDHPMLLQGFDIRAGATIFLDGERVGGSIRCENGDFSGGFCATQELRLELESPPTVPGLYLLQVQNPDGPLSNELPICVAPLAACF